MRIAVAGAAPAEIRHAGMDLLDFMRAGCKETKRRSKALRTAREQSKFKVPSPQWPTLAAALSAMDAYSGGVVELFPGMYRVGHLCIQKPAILTGYESVVAQQRVILRGCVHILAGGEYAVLRGLTLRSGDDDRGLLVRNPESEGGKGSLRDTSLPRGLSSFVGRSQDKVTTSLDGIRLDTRAQALVGSSPGEDREQEEWSTRPPTLWIEAGTPRVEDCDIGSDRGPCVLVAGTGTDPWVSGNVIHPPPEDLGNDGGSVLFRDGASGHLDANVIVSGTRGGRIGFPEQPRGALPEAGPVPGRNSVCALTPFHVYRRREELSAQRHPSRRAPLFAGERPASPLVPRGALRDLARSRSASEACMRRPTTAPPGGRSELPTDPTQSEGFGAAAAAPRRRRVERPSLPPPIDPKNADMTMLYPALRGRLSQAPRSVLKGGFGGCGNVGSSAWDKEDGRAVQVGPASVSRLQGARAG